MKQEVIISNNMTNIKGNQVNLFSKDEKGVTISSTSSACTYYSDEITISSTSGTYYSSGINISSTSGACSLIGDNKAIKETTSSSSLINNEEVISYNLSSD